jgi:hypothetical protein
MLTSKHNFVVTVRDASGKEVYRGVVDGMQPCYEDLLFSAVVAGVVPNDGAILPASVEPVRTVEQRLAGVILSLGSFRKFYSRTVFACSVWSALVALQSPAQLDDEEPSLMWDVEVHANDTPAPKTRFVKTVRRGRYPLSEAAAGEFQIQSEAQKSDGLLLYVSKAILAEMAAETANSLDRERADFLTGRLVRDGQGQVSVIAEGRFPAKMETSASSTHFAFSPATFQAAQEELDRRCDGAVLVGWHHNHPPACGKDCLMTLPPCGTKTVFFSPNDRVVHWTSFPAPYMVALVSGKDRDRRADDPVFCAFGWRDGVIQRRAFMTF